MCMVTVYHTASSIFTAHHTGSICIVQFTGAMQPQACPMMLLASVKIVVMKLLTTNVSLVVSLIHPRTGR